MHLRKNSRDPRGSDMGHAETSLLLMSLVKLSKQSPSAQHSLEQVNADPALLAETFKPALIASQQANDLRHIAVYNHVTRKPVESTYQRFATGYALDVSSTVYTLDRSRNSFSSVLKQYERALRENEFDIHMLFTSTSAPIQLFMNN